MLFPDPVSTKRALVSRGTPLPPEVVPAAEGGEGLVRHRPKLPVPDSLADVANLPYVWHKVKGVWVATRVKPSSPASHLATWLGCRVGRFSMWQGDLVVLCASLSV